jgi:glycosyltransferase involved in cell wall biosynthesis
VENGIPPDATTVIRPGVDFGAIRRARETVTRESMGLPATGRVLLTPSPPSREGGQFEAVWSAAILHLIWPDASMIVPGTSREGERIRRLGESIYCPQMFQIVGERYTRAELLAVADALIVAAKEDIPTGWIAWAMAAGVPVIGVANYAVTELIADRHNGFLCKTAEPHALATRIRLALEDPEMVRQCVTTARSQAYDVFRLQGCVSEYVKVIDNVSGGRPVFDAIKDSALM